MLQSVAGCSAVLVPLYVVLSMSAAEEMVNHVANPGFEAEIDDERGWQVPGSDNVSIIDHDGGKCLQVAMENERHATRVSQEVPIPAGARVVLTEAVLSGTSLQLGEQSWQCPRVTVQFFSDSGSDMGYGGGPSRSMECADRAIMGRNRRRRTTRADLLNFS